VVAFSANRDVDALVACLYTLTDKRMR